MSHADFLYKHLFGTLEVKNLKTMKKLQPIGIAILLLIASATFNACKKTEKGETGPQGPAGAQGPQAKTFNFSLTFFPGDTYNYYTGITGFTSDDVILTFFITQTTGSTNYYTQIPATIGNLNIYPDFSEIDGTLYINTKRADGIAGSPWTATTTLVFKAVLISSSQLAANGDIDFKNYNQVKERFNLKD